MPDFRAVSDAILLPSGVSLAYEDDGSGPPIVLLHGLTASRGYVVMGSHTLERAGHRVVRYDARGHGESTPAPARDDYGYAALCGDLGELLDRLEIERAVLAGASMGAHTILRYALESPERVAALCVITPAFEPAELQDAERLVRWDTLADALERGGIDGFVDAYGIEDVPAVWRETIERVLRQRLAKHAHLTAIADALRAVPRSAPFGDVAELAAIAAPTVVVASGDEADPGHPFAVGALYAETIPGAQLVTEEEGRSPLAWQGGQLSRVIADLAASAATA